MPTTNSFFSNTTGFSNEIELLDDLVMEQIQIYGVDILYLPRKDLNLDKVLHESTKAAFEFAMPIPLYIKNFYGYAGNLELLTKFGVRSSDEITFIMSRSHWEQGYAQYVKSYYHTVEGSDPKGDLDELQGHTEFRPKEGDLIYFPFDEAIFELKYTMFDKPFFQFGQGYIFELQCEKFEFSGELFDTSYESVTDEFNGINEYYTIEFDLLPGIGSFDRKERVRLYNFEETNNPSVGNPPSIEEFRMYFNPGFLKGVPYIEGNVTYWDKPNRILRLNNLSDVDPDTQDLYKNVTQNKLDNVLIVSSNNQTVYISRDSKTVEAAFNDAKNVQEEFDQIQIIDDADDNVFGFV